MPEIFALKTSEIQEYEVEHAETARKIAGECIVLLENDGVLPLKSAGKLALYGNGARKTVKGGTGSGDVNTRDNVNIEAGLESAGFVITTKSHLDSFDRKFEREKNAYLSFVKETAEKKNTSTVAISFNNPMKEIEPVPVTDEDVENSDTDTAIYVISRNSGEGADRYNEKGDYLIFDRERENLEFLAKSYKNLILVLNIGGVMDLSEVSDIEGINAVILLGQLGNIGGYALADIVCGKVTPSGKLTDTWAINYMDYPSSAEFSHNDGNIDDEYYKEGIFVGYRYFDSIGKRVLYPFGYGRSYTDFEIRFKGAEVNKTKLTLNIEVTNAGSEFSGKEVVQVYCSAPSGRLIKPKRELVAFAKTSELKPAEKEDIRLSFNMEDCASYSETEQAWVLEKGKYIISVGNSLCSAEAAAGFRLDRDVTVMKTSNLFKYESELKEMEIAPKESGDFGGIPLVDIDTEIFEKKEVVYQGKRESFPVPAESGITLSDIRAGKNTVEDLVACLSVKELAELCVGTLRTGEGEIVGNASYVVPGAAGDTSAVIKETRGIKNIIMADGPAGLRLQPHFKMNKKGEYIPGGEIILDIINPFPENLDEAEVTDYYQYCTAIPIGWSLAQSWNMELLLEAGNLVGDEMERFGIDLWLAPALNIHRNPLCGRNFEYYSEDPVVSGKCAAAVTKGVQAHAGKGTVIKHFAVNNQEDNRYFTNAAVSERALREIYLKGFEIAVKEAAPIAVMTSYNLINGIHAANSYDLLQAVLRDEWGYDGMVMTDWYTSQFVPDLTGDYKPIYPISASSGCIFAGNDVQMPGCEKNVEDIIRAVETGEEVDGFTITMGDLQFCAANVIRAAVRLTI